MTSSSGTSRDLSIIVPTRNRRDSLLRLLRSLDQQTLSPSAFEVILVDDGSTDGTAKAVARLDPAFPLRVVYGQGKGAAPARADGADAAECPLLLFLDDDLSLDPGAVAAHLAAHSGGPDWQPVAVIGPYDPIHTPTRDPFRILTRNWWEDIFAEMARPGHRASYRDVLSGNLSIPRATFRAIGGFDRRFLRMRCEDWELGVRLMKHAVPIACCPEARADHFENETTSLDRALGDAGREGRGFAILDRIHPEMAPERSLDAPLGDGHTKRFVFALAQRGGGAVELLMRSLRLLLTPLAWFRNRRAWGHLYGMLHLYFFWRGYLEPLNEDVRPANYDSGTAGAAEAAGAAEDGAAADGGHTTASGDSPRATPLVEDVEIGDGLQPAEEQLDRTRPDGLRILLNGRPVGNIPVHPGAERLRGRHLRRLLERNLSDSLGKALLES